MRGRPGFFDLDERYTALSAAGDPLERLSAVIDFELFRGELDAALARSDRAKGGRPPYDAVLMFKILVVQTLYTLSDDQTRSATVSRSCASWGWRCTIPCRMPRPSGCSASS
jgi:transposase, IS5 family